MKNILIILSVFIASVSCQDMKVGFLKAENAKYAEDTMTVKRTLSDSEEDVKREKFKIPWIGLPIEGIEGTRPIFLSIKSVKSTAGNAAEEKFMEVVDMRGDGSVVVPVGHDLPVGYYVISVNIENEDYYYELKDAFTLIVIEE